MRGFILSGAALALTTLAGPRPASAAAPPARAARTVTVRNTRGVPVVVYLERGDFDTRLGTIAANAQGVLPVPRFMNADETARIVVEPKVGTDLASPDLTLPAEGSLKILVTPNDVGYVPTPRPVIPNLDPNATTLTVDNPRDEAVDVFLEKGVFDTRIGTVKANQLRTFDIPPYLARDESQVQLFLRPKRGFDLSSQFLTLRPKAHLEVVVPKRDQS